MSSMLGPDAVPSPVHALKDLIVKWISTWLIHGKSSFSFLHPLRNVTESIQPTLLLYDQTTNLSSDVNPLNSGFWETTWLSLM
jgi:hypothetical protein